MRTGLLAFAFSALVALAACAPAAPPIPPGAPFGTAPMTLTQRGQEPVVKLVEVHADGAILGPQGQPLGKIQGTKIVGAKGEVLLEVGSDGLVQGPELTRKLRFNGEGELTDEKGTIKIGTDGVVITMDSTGELTRTPLKYANYDVAQRRTGEIVLVLVAKHLGKLTDLGIE